MPAGVYSQDELRDIGENYAHAYGVDWDIFDRQINEESRWNPNARSSAGARGIAQIMPETARAWGVNPDDPIASLAAAAKHDAEYLKRYGSWAKALVAYNAGPGYVEKWNGTRATLNAESTKYLNDILGPDWESGGVSGPTDPPPVSGTIDLSGLGKSFYSGIKDAIVGSIGKWGDFFKGTEGSIEDAALNATVGIAGMVLVTIGIFALVLRSPPVQAAAGAAASSGNPLVAAGGVATKAASAPFGGRGPTMQDYVRPFRKANSRIAVPSDSPRSA